jgi:hypothetical protein
MLPRRSGTERLALGWGGGVLGLAVVLFLIRLADPMFLADRPRLTPSEANFLVSIVALCAAFFGLAMGKWRFVWLAVIPGAIGVLTLFEHISGRDIGIDQLILSDSFHEFSDPTAPGRMSVLAAGCLVFATVFIALKALDRGRRHVLPAAVTGSLIFTAGLATVLGHLADLPAIYLWGSFEPTLLSDGLLLMALGPGMVLGAWVEDIELTGKLPAWFPLRPSVKRIGFENRLTTNLH